MAEIKLVNLVKRYGDVVAVDRTNLTAEDKEFLVLVGSSGCGKTTTLRMIAGLEKVSEGEIYIGDRLVRCFSSMPRPEMPTNPHWRSLDADKEGEYLPCPAWDVYGGNFGH